jgi:hypothetical protein
MADCSCATFTLESTSYTIYLNKPNYGNGHDASINNQVDVFNFWDKALDIVPRGLDTEPLSLGGYEILCGDNIGICFPICFPICFAGPLSTKFENINALMDDHEEVTISGLGDSVDGVYVIQNFEFGTVRGSPNALWWRLSLQYVRRE